MEIEGVKLELWEALKGGQQSKIVLAGKGKDPSTLPDNWFPREKFSTPAQLPLKCNIQKPLKNGTRSVEIVQIKVGAFSNDPLHNP